MDNTNNHQDLKNIDRSTSAKEGQVEDTAQAEFKQKSSKKLDDIFTYLNQALQELADSGKPLVLIPFESPGPEWGCYAPPLDDLKEVFKVPPEEPDANIPCDGKQTVDHLVLNTNDLDLKQHATLSRGYIFNIVCGKLGMLKSLRTEDVIEARKRLGLPTVLIESVTQVNKPKPSLPGSPDSSSLGMIKTPTKPGTTVVHAERVVVNNKKMIMILNFENIEKFDELPIEYKSSFPNFYKSASGIALLAKSDKSAKANAIYAGDIMSPTNFDKMINTMKEAAAQLSKINKTAKLEKEHSGKFMVEI